MTPRLIIGSLLAVLLGLTIYLFIRPSSISPSKSDNGNDDKSNAVATSTASKVPISQQKATPDRPDKNDKRIERRKDGTNLFVPAVEISHKLAQTDDPLETLEYIDQILGIYRYFFKENPVSTGNKQVLEQLMGKNKYNLVFLDSDNRRILDGQLIDQWGTPYFFHALEADQMEIRSAGVDKVMWTSDDLSNDMGD